MEEQEIKDYSIDTDDITKTPDEQLEETANIVRGGTVDDECGEYNICNEDIPCELIFTLVAIGFVILIISLFFVNFNI